MPALIADRDRRRRDERFATQALHHTTPDPLHNKAGADDTLARFVPGDFQYDPVARTCVCPAGKSLYRKGQSLVIRGFVSEVFRGAKRDCLPCVLRARCLRDPTQATPRQVAFFRGRAAAPPTHTAQMKDRMDAPTGRALYGQRFAIVEPVFANLRANKRLDRFTLRGRRKVEGQWTLFCLVHNIEKLAHYGVAA